MASEDPGTEPTPPIVERVPASLVLRWAVAGTIGVLGVLLAAYGLYVVRGVLVLILVGLFVAISLEPAVQWLVTKGVRRTYAVTIVIFVALALFVAFVWSIVPPIVEQGGSLVRDLPADLQRLSTQSRAVREITDRYHLTDRLTALVAAIPANLAGGAVGLVQRFLGALASTLTVLVLAVYFMADMPRLRRGVAGLFPHRRRPRVTEIVDVVVDKVGAYMIGNLIISLVAGAATFACLELVRVPFALPLAVTVALTDLIPMVGATLGAIICVAVSALTADIWPQTVVVLLFFIAYQQLENYLIAPRVLRNTVDLPAVVVLLVALVGGTVMGLVGAVMAIPVAATVKVVLTPRMAALHEPPPTPAAGGRGRTNPENRSPG